MEYKPNMNVTIRNLDEDLYRRLKAHAARTGQTVAAVVEQAAAAWLAQVETPRRRARLADLQPVDLGPGTERTSEEVDELLARREGLPLATFDRRALDRFPDVAVRPGRLANG